MCSNLGHIGPEKSNRGILLSQNKLLVLCTFNCYRMIDSDPLWSNLLQPAGNHFQSGYTAFMVTSSRRRRMWWARKANARGMHVWKGRAACARGWYTWQVIEINKKMLVTKGMNRTLSNARSGKKTNKQTNKQSHFCIMHFLKDNNKHDSYNKLNSLSFCFRSEVSGQRNYFSFMSYDCPTREKSKNWKH